MGEEQIAHEFHAQHARCFATTGADRQLNDACAERCLRVEGAERRARSTAVRRVAGNRSFDPACLARSRPTAARASGVHARAQDRRVGRVCLV